MQKILPPIVAAIGSQLNTDLSDNWDFWPYVELPLDEARAKLNVPPPAGGYPLAIAEAAIATSV